MALKKVRALPSDPAANDLLKVEYIDVNLNNSRKLISNIVAATTVSRGTTAHAEATAEDMLRLRNVRHELSWVDELVPSVPDERA